jgi:predicted DNA-binding transcriptional regulator AlpA
MAHALTLHGTPAAEQHDAVESGHSPGTAASESLVRQGRQRGDAAQEAVVPHRLKATVAAWPRLLSVEQAAQYLGISFWTVREFINDKSIKAVPLPRPETLRQRERRTLGDTVRRLLIDRHDLDALVETWKQRA